MAASTRPSFALTDGGVVLAPARLPAPTLTGAVAAHPFLFDVALHLGADGTPEILLNDRTPENLNGTRRPATPDDIIGVMTTGALPVPEHMDRHHRRQTTGAPWRNQVWSGQWVRLLVATPEEGSPRYDTFQAWVERFRAALADRAPGSQALHEVYAPVGGAETRFEGPRPIGAPPVTVFWSDPANHRPVPGLVRSGAAGESSLWLGDSGSIVSGTTFDDPHAYTYHGVVRQYGLHTIRIPGRDPIDLRMHGVDPYELRPVAGLLPLDIIVVHDGSLALIGPQGPMVVKAEDLARLRCSGRTQPTTG
ncbi:hypothetical protein ACFXKJ_41270, partial [Kitasatospora indigofera]|uniref:hypothetical protein n=1 Tax=Kitasatospora indigofera TaxID=67307 RepID=UPI00367DD8EE